ncbi:protein PHLOEM PROTEIN 2-LIKE A1-like [Corylus avellana]|uniref:protein PHLOEM PROTEIN 2-LIKE A1-like n=1 Tax=Corylus avellana TaxID=13451 RepID=UPI001E2178D6|nr:protein PHLOEM PROTEIN 2-LIKE A1-like [Corylus avellana]
MAKRAVTDLIEAESGEIFLEHKRKKKRADEKTVHYSFTVYARSLYISWADCENWTWTCFKEKSDEIIEVAKLSHVCWLDVRGNLDISELSTEVVYVVKLTEGASGWELPIQLKLAFPDGRVQVRQVSLLEKPRKQWIELNVGNFQRKKGELGEVRFLICEHGGHWKRGLIIKGAVIRPKQTTTL